MNNLYTYNIFGKNRKKKEIKIINQFTDHPIIFYVDFPSVFDIFNNYLIQR